MTWMWLSVAVILIGAKLNSETEHKTARDSTEGDPKPMGARRENGRYRGRETIVITGTGRGRVERLRNG